MKHVPFPGSKGQVRLLVHADGTYELEARRWGTVDGLREGREPEMFAPLEYGDKGAATLRVSGSWTERHEPNFKVEKVEQLSNGDAEPPITEKEIHYACGKSLGRPLKAHLPRDNKNWDVMWLDINEYLKFMVTLRHARDDEGRSSGWADDEDEIP